MVRASPSKQVLASSMGLNPKKSSARPSPNSSPSLRRFVVPSSARRNATPSEVRREFARAIPQRIPHQVISELSLDEPPQRASRSIQQSRARLRLFIVGREVPFPDPPRPWDNGGSVTPLLTHSHSSPSLAPDSQQPTRPTPTQQAYAPQP